MGLPAHLYYVPDPAVRDRRVSLAERPFASVNATQELDFMAAIVIDEPDVVVREAHLQLDVRSIVEELHRR